MNQRKTQKNNMKKIKEFKIKFDIKTLFIVLFASFFIFALVSPLLRGATTPTVTKSLSEVIGDIKKNRVQKIIVEDNKVIAEYKDKSVVETSKEPNDSFREILQSAGIGLDKINVETRDSSGSEELLRFLANILPAVLLFFLFMYIIRQARGAQDSVFSFGQSKAKRFNKDVSKITFKDVAGVNEAKEELEEVVDFLKNNEKYKKVGARTPKGVILVGPAGSGKTLLAKAVAGEAGVPFFSIAGSEFMEMLVGIGAARARDLFATAKKNAPSILFIDEIDAIGRARSSGVMPAHDEREQTLNQILVEMDGFTPNEQVIVIAATNRGDLLDTALLRPGRFDRRVMVDYPDVEGRKNIMQIHGKNKPFDEKVNWDRVAKRTVGFSGADLENMLNEAAITAARGSHEKIMMEDIEEAATKVKLGPEKKRLQTDFDRKITAYHEAGHAIVSHFQPHTDTVHRISIVSRGMALGYTLIPPDRDRLHVTRTELLERLAVMMGGRAAEEVIFSEITTGAANDFDQATNIAKNMVMDYGMSSLGPVNLGPTMDVTEWGKSYWEQNQLSQETMSKIDTEVKKILMEAYERAKQIVIKNRKKMDLIAEELVKVENLDQDEFEKIVGPKPKPKVS